MHAYNLKSILCFQYNCSTYLITYHVNILQIMKMGIDVGNENTVAKTSGGMA